jgi:2-phosphosulfolactate phosphatase
LKIVRKSCAQGAREAYGVAVIIDVFRAFSCEPLFFHFGVGKVILEADPQKAILTKKEHPEFILVGESNEVPLENADLGNSPSEIVLKGEAWLKGRTVVHRTTAGVTGAAAALETAEEVILASFLTAKAVAGYILRKKPHVVTLVAMGDRGLREAPEDEACADYLEHLLTGKSYDAVGSLRRVVFHPSAQKFLLGTQKYLPREDPVFCLQRDLFDFVLVAKREGGRIEVRRTISSPHSSL